MIRPHRAALALALALALATPAAAARRPARPAPPPPPPPAPVSLKVERHVLANGLVVLLHEDHTVPAVTFWQWYEVGSRNERPGITGISHYFEHMMFNGSPNVPPKMYDRILESNGGNSNAFTSRDMTAYYEDIASDRLETVLQLDSDRMRALTFEPQALASEIGVVKEERRMSVDNDIFGMLTEQLWATAFNASPYRTPVLGWMGDLERIARPDMVEYFRTYYAPNNCVLVLAGDFESTTALALIRKYFESIPRQEPPRPPVDSEPPQRGERRVEVHYPAQQVSFMVGYKAPAATHADQAALEVLASILADGESSRLHQALVYEQQLALFAGASSRAMLGPNLFQLYAQLRPGKTAAEGLAALDSVVARVRREGPGERELQKAKNLLEAQFVTELKINNGVGRALAFYEHVYGDHRALEGAVARYRAVTAADVRRVADTWLDPLHRTVSTLVPDESAAEGGER
jgi:zinc protease